MGPTNLSGQEPSDAPPAIATGANAATGDYAPVTDFDTKTVEMKKQLEPVVYNKVMSDLSHVTWAYGVIFVIFAAYAAYLWRKTVATAADVEALRRTLDKRD